MPERPEKGHSLQVQWRKDGRADRSPGPGSPGRPHTCRGPCWREGVGSTSRLWEGLCPTASGRRPPAQVTDTPCDLMERNRVATLLSAAEGSLLWREVRCPGQTVCLMETGLNPGLSDYVPVSPSPAIILQPGQSWYQRKEITGDP